MTHHQSHSKSPINAGLFSYTKLLIDFFSKSLLLKTFNPNFLALFIIVLFPSNAVFIVYNANELL